MRRKAKYPRDRRYRAGPAPVSGSGHAAQPWPAPQTVPVRLDLPVVGHSAAFFDLDKTVIAKSSALAFGKDPLLLCRRVCFADAISAAA